MVSTLSLADAVRRRRRELGLTQEQLAERISADGEYVRQSEISRIERGQVTLPRRERLERLARALEMTLGELLECSGWNGAAERFDEPPPPAVAAPAVPAPAPAPPRPRPVLVSTGVTTRAGAIREQREALQRAMDALASERERLERNITAARLARATLLDGRALTREAS